MIDIGHVDGFVVGSIPLSRMYSTSHAFRCLCVTSNMRVVVIVDREPPGTPRFTKVVVIGEIDPEDDPVIASAEKLGWAFDGEVITYRTTHFIFCTLMCKYPKEWTWTTDGELLIFRKLLAEPSDVHLLTTDGHVVTLPKLIADASDFVRSCRDLDDGALHLQIPFDRDTVTESLQAVNRGTVRLRHLHLLDFLHLDGLDQQLRYWHVRVPFLEEAMPYAIEMSSGLECVVSGMKRDGDKIVSVDTDTVHFAVHDNVATEVNRTCVWQLYDALRQQGYSLNLKDDEWLQEGWSTKLWRFVGEKRKVRCKDFDVVFDDRCVTFTSRVSRLPMLEPLTKSRVLEHPYIRYTFSRPPMRSVEIVRFEVMGKFQLPKPHFGFEYEIDGVRVKRVRCISNVCTIKWL